MLLLTKSGFFKKAVIAAVILTVLASGYLLVGDRLLGGENGEEEPNSREEMAAEEEEELATRVICFEAVIDDIEISNDFNITLEASKEYSIHPRLDGEVEHVNFDVGDRVEKGEVLAEIDDERYRAELEQAQAGLAAAEAELRRLETGTPEEELEQVRASMQEAQASVEGARRDVGYSEEIFEERTPDDMEIEEIETEYEQAERQLEIAEKELRQAELSYEDAEDNYERMSSLYEDGAISEREYEEALRGKEQAQSQLEAAEAGMRQSESALKGTETLKNMTIDLYDFRAEEEQMVSQARTQYEAAEASLEAAEAALAEAERGPTQEEIDAARARVEEAGAGVELASTVYDDVKIEAPADGTIAQVEIEEGETASPEAPLFYMVNLEVMEAVANINEPYVNQIEEGDEAPVTIYGAAEEEFTGRVNTISPLASEQGGFPVELRVPNPDEQIKSGMRGSIELIVDESQDTLLISQDATFEPEEHEADRADSSYKAVYVIDDENRARYQTVETGLETKDIVEIKSGLEEGDRLILHDQGRIEDGQKVEVVESETI
ncbi:efflux RND transporter periplasmic adaptor subunit [Halarsenatibacter silvermanii]|uniref:RND family efflux transporter, MFP subunit n=1 Tax=Halarsenatibacter silvermanii TaxID=321763 RepID=A0A1G9SJA3_9FIRM|nr:efflux RND transporter periplasmic adaptor subunit [Halarsenatibacter silvermanii]SDM35509.1 RND family efflux transporter, MFP subunit [Halarsenatibacter silvermanii]